VSSTVTSYMKPQSSSNGFIVHFEGSHLSKKSLRVARWPLAAEQFAEAYLRG
jgi:hypothetical protein